VKPRTTEPTPIKSANVASRPEREVGSEQTDRKSKQVRGGKWNIGVAALFALLGFPATVGLFLLDVHSLLMEYAQLDDWLAGAAVSLVAPTLITSAVLWRGSKITTLEIAMYWVGFAGAFMFAVVLLVAMPGELWNWNYDIHFFPFAAGASIGVISTAYLMIRRGPQIGTLELLLYWLGCSVPFIFVLIAFVLPGDGPPEEQRNLLFISTPALAIITALAIRAYWRKSRRLV
jgi:hypothetical protein